MSVLGSPATADAAAECARLVVADRQRITGLLELRDLDLLIGEVAHEQCDLDVPDFDTRAR